MSQHHPASSDQKESSFRRRSLLRSGGAVLAGLLAGCNSVPFIEGGAEVVDWNRKGPLSGETTFVIDLRNGPLSDSVTDVTIKFRARELGKGRTVGQKTQRINLDSGERRTVRITTIVPPATRSWVIYTENVG